MDIAADECAGLYAAALQAIPTMGAKGRAEIARFLAEQVRARHGAETTAETWLVDGLKLSGRAHLGSLLTRGQCQTIAAKLSAAPCYASHVPAQSDGTARNLDETRLRAPYGSYKLADALAIPELLALARSPRLLGIAGAYLGCTPTVYSVHAWWTFAGLNRPGLTHALHRDYDDFASVAVFVYLTDVGIDGGPFRYVLGTHVDDRMIGAEEVFQGPAGTAFAIDPSGLHRGALPVAQDRLVCWLRYGLCQNRGYVNDRTEPVASDAAAEWPFRLILK